MSYSNCRRYIIYRLPIKNYKRLHPLHRRSTKSDNYVYSLENKKTERACILQNNKEYMNNKSH